MAERQGARYEGAITHLEIGRRLDDGEHLRLAEAEFADMGAAYWLGEARRALSKELNMTDPVPALEQVAEA